MSTCHKPGEELIRQVNPTEQPRLSAQVQSRWESLTEDLGLFR
jgi:hypothetical protein